MVLDLLKHGSTQAECLVHSTLSPTLAACRLLSTFWLMLALHLACGLSILVSKHRSQIKHLHIALTLPDFEHMHKAQQRKRLHWSRKEVKPMYPDEGYRGVWRLMPQGPSSPLCPMRCVLVN